MPYSRVLAFDQPEAYVAAVRATDVELLLTSRGDFRAELVQVDLGRLLMQRGADSLPRIVRMSNHPNRAPIVFLADPEQASVRQAGVEVAPGEIIVFSPAATSYQRTKGPCRWASMSLSAEHLADASSCLVARELTPPSSTHVVRPDPPLMARLMTLHDATIQLAKTAPAILAHAQVARSLEQELLHAMVKCIDIQRTGTRSAARQRTRVVANFEDFLAARRYEPVYLAEICTAIGVSERTLRSCCHEHLGMGPIHYLWLRRMHLAHRALLLADPGTRTVTEIATDHGFWELGRFSVEYRLLFGEAPSISLQRPPEKRWDAAPE